MNNPKPIPRSGAIARLELHVLGGICSHQANSESLTDAIGRLDRYEWTMPDHQVVYAAVSQVFRAAGKVSLDGVAAQTTRAGFPDIDWTYYFREDSDEAGKLPLGDRVSELLGRTG